LRGDATSVAVSEFSVSDMDFYFLVLVASTEKKFPAGPGEATENHFTFASGGWGYPPDPH
jgi:hypothetical protein